MEEMNEQDGGHVSMRSFRWKEVVQKLANAAQASLAESALFSMIKIRC
jgi:hypothetical protein